MATPKWNPSTLYPTGSLVQPRTAAITNPDPVSNGSFETGNLDDWDYTTVGGAGTLVVRNQHPAVGTYAAYWEGGNGSGSEGGIECNARSQDRAPVSAGLLVTVTVRIKYNTTGGEPKGSRGAAQLYWFDAGGNQIGNPVRGNVISGRGNNNRYVTSSVSGQPPAGAVTCAAGAWVTARGGHVYFDDVKWNYSGAVAPAGLIFRATQPTTQRSADTEPTWPTTVGVTVNDGGVVWEGVIANRVVWQARPLMRSGDTEPAWPEVVGETVQDGTVVWRTTTMHIDDPRCPNTEIVTIMVSKVFCGDDDIVAYSATTNPLDWSKVKDAGYLPTGLNVLGSNPVAALGPYRGNLIVSNAEGFQMWQVDEDPANMAILDALPVSSEEHWAMAPVSNDLFMLASQGVRTIGIAAASTNLAAGDVGLPVDPLVRVNHKAAKAAGERVHGFYFPGAGQYFLCFNLPGNWPIRTELWPDGYDYQCVAHVYTMSQIGSVGAWSRYLFPFRVDAWAIIGDMVVIRSGDDIIELDEDLVNDFVMDEEGWGDVGQPFPGVIWWPWLDFGSPGYEKSTEGFDIVSIGSPAVEIGFAQQQDPDDDTYFTEPYQLDPDTITGDMIPYEMTAPSMSVRLTYNGGEKWRFLAMNLYLYTRRG